MDMYARIFHDAVVQLDILSDIYLVKDTHEGRQRRASRESRGSAVENWTVLLALEKSLNLRVEQSSSMHNDIYLHEQASSSHGSVSKGKVLNVSLHASMTFVQR